MGTVLRRIVVPCLLLVAGIASTIYGARHHVIPVVQEREEEVTLPIPSPFGPGSSEPGGSPFPGAPPFADGQLPGMPPVWQPPPAFAKVIKKTILTFAERESKIVREASVGGVMLADSGEIKRTYSGDEGPALCPT